MKNALLFFAVLFATMIASCSKSKSDSSACSGGTDVFQLNKSFSLCYDNVAVREGNPDFKIEFKSLVEESRCPSDAICVRAGSVAVGLAIAINDTVSQLDTLALGDTPSGYALSDSLVVSGFKIKLLRVDPYPALSAGNVPSEEYKVQLVVSQ